MVKTNQLIENQIRLNNRIREIEAVVKQISDALEDKLNIVDKSEEFESKVLELRKQAETQLKELYEENKENKEALKLVIEKLCYIIELKEAEIGINAKKRNELANRNKSIVKTVMYLQDSIFNIMSIGRFIDENKEEEEKSLVVGAYRVGVAVDKLDIPDTKRVPNEYKKEQISRVVDEKKIKQAIVDGEDIQFAKLVKSLSIKPIARSSEDEL